MCGGLWQSVAVSGCFGAADTWPGRRAAIAPAVGPRKCARPRPQRLRAAVRRQRCCRMWRRTEERRQGSLWPQSGGRQLGDAELAGLFQSVLLVVMLVHFLRLLHTYKAAVASIRFVLLPETGATLSRRPCLLRFLSLTLARLQFLLFASVRFSQIYLHQLYERSRLSFELSGVYYFSQSMCWTSSCLRSYFTYAFALRLYCSVLHLCDSSSVYISLTGEIHLIWTCTLLDVLSL